jgi:transposase
VSKIALLMKRDRQLKQKVIRNVAANRMTRTQAAKLLGVSIRTIHNYMKNYALRGPEGLQDHRHGHYRKIEPEQEIRILACKLDQPSSSARWVRDRLKLPVSVEAVRQVLLRHRLNRSSLGIVDLSLKHPRGWNPF